MKFEDNHGPFDCTAYSTSDVLDECDECDAVLLFGDNLYLGQWVMEDEE